ncbi:hypothetical protein Hanom_Chr14g01248361 [Helianthus anomalus]
MATHPHPRHNSFMKQQTLNDNQIQPLQEIQIRAAAAAAAVHHHGISLKLCPFCLYSISYSLFLSIDHNLCALF